jgi:hypothetical protein
MKTKSPDVVIHHIDVVEDLRKAGDVSGWRSTRIHKRCQAYSSGDGELYPRWIKSKFLEECEEIGRIVQANCIAADSLMVGGLPAVENQDS